MSTRSMVRSGSHSRTAEAYNSNQSFTFRVSHTGSGFSNHTPTVIAALQGRLFKIALWKSQSRFQDEEGPASPGNPCGMEQSDNCQD